MRVKENPCTDCCRPYRMAGKEDWEIPMIPVDYVCEHLIKAGREMRRKARENWLNDLAFKEKL